MARVAHARLVFATWAKSPIGIPPVDRLDQGLSARDPGLATDCLNKLEGWDVLKLPLP